MITILTKNKERIIDCNDVYVCNERVFGQAFNISAVLGTYATEERAKEVLLEIWNQIGQGICTQRYEMPKE